MNLIPQSVEDLWAVTTSPTTAVFYTIWSYQAGAGRKLIQATQSYLREQEPTVTTYVTLSPKTEMARKFHLNNGANILQENADTVNYIYSWLFVFATSSRTLIKRFDCLRMWPTR